MILTRDLALNDNDFNITWLEFFILKYQYALPYVLRMSLGIK